MAVNLVRAELQVRLNVTESCAKFAFFRNVDSIGKELMKAAKSEKKILLKKTLISLLLPQTLHIFKDF
jgi:hypothetical protein